MSIVDNLRIMGDALVLLNPVKNFNNQSVSMQVPGQSDPGMEQEQNPNIVPHTAREINDNHLMSHDTP